MIHQYRNVYVEILGQDGWRRLRRRIDRIVKAKRSPLGVPRKGTSDD